MHFIHRCSVFVGAAAIVAICSATPRVVHAAAPAVYDERDRRRDDDLQSAHSAHHDHTEPSKSDPRRGARILRADLPDQPNRRRRRRNGGRQ